MSRAAGALLLLALAAVPTGGVAQHITIGPQFAVVDYREVSSGLRYTGSGGGGVAMITYRKFSLAAAVVRLSLDPTSRSTAGTRFTATQVDAWLGYDVSSYASIEVGLIRRTADPEFDAQSLGAVRVGARSSYALGPGATVLFRANYLAAPRFSGGGRASLSLEVGLGLDVRLLGRLHALADYAVQRVDRKTDPGGQGEVDAPIRQSVARVGLGIGF